MQRPCYQFTITCKIFGYRSWSKFSGEITANSIIQNVILDLIFMYRKANCLSMETKKTLLSALTQCHFDYLTFPSWFAGVSQTLKYKLQIAENKTVRLIKSMGPRSSIRKSELSSFWLLNVEDRVKQLRLNYAHKIDITNASVILKKISEKWKINIHIKQDLVKIFLQYRK